MALRFESDIPTPMTKVLMLGEAANPADRAAVPGAFYGVSRLCETAYNISPPSTSPVR